MLSSTKELEKTIMRLCNNHLGIFDRLSSQDGRLFFSFRKFNPKQLTQNIRKEIRLNIRRGNPDGY